MPRVLIITCMIWMTGGCSSPDSGKMQINLSFTPWMGYYPFYYAIETGVTDKHNVKLRILETLTVQDFRRANIKEHVDAFACSLVELTRTNTLLDEPVDIVSLLDYSNGADVIIAHKSFATFDELQGKRIGFDWRALGHFVLLKAVQNSNWTEFDFVHNPVEQVSAEEAFEEGRLDAYITYPPISNRLLENDELHIVFDSTQIPFEILDVLAIKANRTDKHQKLQIIWNETLDIIEQDPEKYMAFVAAMSGLSLQEVQREMANVALINENSATQVSPQRFSELLEQSCSLLGESASQCTQGLKKIRRNGVPAT